MAVADDLVLQTLLAALPGVLVNHHGVDWLAPEGRGQQLVAVRVVLARQVSGEIFLVEPGVLVVLGAVRVARAVMEFRRVSHLIKELLPALVALLAVQFQATPTLHGLPQVCA